MSRDLYTWWMATSYSEIDSMMPKVVEYGATDLMWVGRQMAEATGRPDITDEEAAENGWFWNEQVGSYRPAGAMYCRETKVS